METLRQQPLEQNNGQEATGSKPDRRFNSLGRFWRQADKSEEVRFQEAEAPRQCR